MTKGPSAELRARPAEIIFEVTETPEGGHDARALGHRIIADVAAFLGLPKQAVRDTLFG